MSNPPKTSMEQTSSTDITVQDCAIEFARTDANGRYYKLGGSTAVTGITVDKSGGFIQFHWHNSWTGTPEIEARKIESMGFTEDGRHYELDATSRITAATINKADGTVQFQWDSARDISTPQQMRDDNTQFELWYSGEGVSITEYDQTSSEPIVKNEWWYTWAELFTELTGIRGQNPSIHSQP